MKWPACKRPVCPSRRSGCPRKRRRRRTSVRCSSGTWEDRQNHPGRNLCRPVDSRRTSAYRWWSGCKRSCTRCSSRWAGRLRGAPGWIGRCKRSCPNRWRKRSSLPAGCAEVGGRWARCRCWTSSSSSTWAGRCRSRTFRPERQIESND